MSVHLYSFDAGKEPGERRFPARKSLQRTADVVNAVFGMARIHDFEDHVIAGFETLDDGVELILGPGCVLVDAGDDQAGLKTLQVGKGTSAYGLDDYARGVQF